MPRFGFEGQLMFGEESTYGTAVTPNRSIEHVSGEVSIGDATVVSPGIRGARERILTATKQGRRVVGYSYQTDFQYKGLGLWFKHALGSSSTTSPVGGVFEHQFFRKDTLPVGLTFEHEISPDFYKLAGSRINELTFECGNEGPARLSIGGPAKDYTIAASGATYSPPASNILGVFHEATFTIDSVAKQFRSFRMRIHNDVQTDDFRSGARTIFSAEAKDYMVEGTVVLTAEENAQLTKLRDFTAANLNVKLVGPVISGVHSHTLDMLMSNSLYRPTTRRISSPTDESLFEMEWEAFASGSIDALILKMKNDQAAASL